MAGSVASSVKRWRGFSGRGSRVDLSRVVSKYAGETEKNLACVLAKLSLPACYSCSPTGSWPVVIAAT